MTILDRLDSDVRYLTAGHLRYVLEDMVKFSPAWDNGGWGFLTLGVATEILRFFLGNDWVDCHVLGWSNEQSTHSASQFLRGPFHPDPGGLAQDWHRQLFRAASLAEHMYNLQHVEGALERFERVRQDDLSAALAELEAAALLSAPHLHVRFRRSIGVRGEDYEGTVVSSWGKLIPWEAKSKLAGADRSAVTFWRTLDEARKQLPKGTRGIVLLRIPDEWAQEVMAHELCSEAIARLFRQTQRVAAVVTFSHEWLAPAAGDAGDIASRPVVRTHLNPGLSSARGSIQEILDSIGRRFNPEWTQIQQLVLDALPVEQAGAARAFVERVGRSLRSAS